MSFNCVCFAEPLEEEAASLTEASQENAQALIVEEDGDQAAEGAESELPSGETKTSVTDSEPAVAIVQRGEPVTGE